MRRHNKRLEELARDMVGDNGKPDIFFVSDKRGVITISLNFDVAYRAWRMLPRNEESALEDRRIGVIANTQPRDDTPNSPLATYDDSYLYHELEQ